MFGQQSDTDVFFSFFFCWTCWRQLWKSTQIFLMKIFLCTASKKRLVVRKGQLFTPPNKETLIHRVNHFRQVLQTAVCCPHKSFIVFWHILPPPPQNSLPKAAAIAFGLHFEDMAKVQLWFDSRHFYSDTNGPSSLWKRKWSVDVSCTLHCQLRPWWHGETGLHFRLFLRSNFRSLTSHTQQLQWVSHFRVSHWAQFSLTRWTEGCYRVPFDCRHEHHWRANPVWYLMRGLAMNFAKGNVNITW